MLLSHKDAVKSERLNSLYQEFNKAGDVVFSYKFKHPLSTTFEIIDNLNFEFDKYDRTTFTTYNGMWCLKYYHEPTAGNKQSMPYHVVHKYWDLYNNSKS